MGNQKKRMRIHQEKVNDGGGGNKRPPSLSSPSTKKIKTNQVDTQSLERMTEQSNRDIENEVITISDDDYFEDPFDGSDEDIRVLNTDDVFRRMGFSNKVQEFIMKKENIRDLYGWQRECLTEPKLLRGENYVMSLKKGAGKNLISELLMLRETLVHNKSCLIILPYIAGTQEKVLSLSVFDELEIFVEEYTGSDGRISPIKRGKGQTIYVATIEKGNLLINNLMKENRLNEIGLVIIDGLHMIGEKGRGGVVEQLIFKYLMFGCGQIVGISTPLGGVDEICKFMKANHFSSNFQPMKFVEKVKIEDTLYNVNDEGDLTQPREMGINNKNKIIDTDGVVPLIKGIVPQKQVIIFCPTKKNCEDVCKMVATLLPTFSSGRLYEQHREIIKNIKNENGGDIEETLEFGIRSGIAYHHSGLTNEERYWIETAFKNGTLYGLCATSTLATGVNFPVRRVIIKQPLDGMNFLGKSQYLQMIYRAGKGECKDINESITIVGKKYEKRFRDMLKSPLKPCQSQMLDENNLKRFIMDLINLKLVEKVDQFPNILSKTLAGIQYNDKYLSLIEKTLESLKEQNMVKVENGKFVHTILGEATFTADLPPDYAKKLYDYLLKELNNGIVFPSLFHLIIMVIPNDIELVINVDLFHNEFRKLSRPEKDLLSRMDIKESQIMNYIVFGKDVEKTSPLVRPYIALIIMDILNKMPLPNVAKKYNLQKGWIQNTLQSVCLQAQRIQRFSEVLKNLWPLETLLPDIIARLNRCESNEITTLSKLDCVTPGIARVLYDKGFETIQSIADAKPSDLVSNIKHLSLEHAKRIIRSAKTVIDEMLNNKEEEMAVYGIKFKLENFITQM
uniref:Mutagen-sensitive 301 (inferred by orthology to a D. melanogaster protein) n=1 Tax=Strongyloides venezuelensis TaxID=75913 RepID=A0A0K0G4A7_STRVS